MSMRSTGVLVAVGLLAAGQALAQDARLTDRDVKQQIEAVEKARDRFEDALDGGLKRSIIRGPRGEVNISDYLDDFQDNVKKLKERFAPGYAASAEVLTVFRQASDIEGFVTRQAPGFKGRSEWDCLAADLSSLAGAYSTVFPTPADAVARRLNDGEVATTADQLVRAADQFKKTGKDTMKLNKTDPATIKVFEAEVNTLSQSAKSLKSRVSGSKPASGDARVVMESAKRLHDMASANGLAPAMAPLSASLEKLGQAFGVAK